MRNFNFVTLFYDHGKNQMSKRAFNHSSGWGPRLRLRHPTSVLVIKRTTLLACIENSYFSIQNSSTFN
jgi:hypothetical protein